MTVPVWVLLLFAAWTLLLLFLTVGYFRWSRILTGRATIREWRPDEDQGTDWYRRAMRAHANCLENLPIYIVVVIALLVTETKSPWLDGLAIILLIARIAHNPWYILAPCRRSSSQVGAKVVLAYAEMKNRSCVRLNAIFSAH
jgi:uncharacterized MAPEG superfamily protein